VDENDVRSAIHVMIPFSYRARGRYPRRPPGDGVIPSTPPAVPDSDAVTLPVPRQPPPKPAGTCPATRLVLGSSLCSPTFDVPLLVWARSVAPVREGGRTTYSGWPGNDAADLGDLAAPRVQRADLGNVAGTGCLDDEALANAEADLCG
jgi:hypothetical protein